VIDIAGHRVITYDRRGFIPAPSAAPVRLGRQGTVTTTRRTLMVTVIRFGQAAGEASGSAEIPSAPP